MLIEILECINDMLIEHNEDIAVEMLHDQPFNKYCKLSTKTHDITF